MLKEMAREVLTSIPVLAGVSDEALNMLADEAMLHEEAVGHNIVEEGQVGHSMFVIRSGRVEVIKKTGLESEVVLASLGTHDFFGEMCIVEPMPRAATVRAAEFTQCWELSAHTFQLLHQRYLADFAIVTLNIARDLARRLRSLDNVFAARA